MALFDPLFTFVVDISTILSRLATTTATFDINFEPPSAPGHGKNLRDQN
jgi:hypothetical protein